MLRKIFMRNDLSKELFRNEWKYLIGASAVSYTHLKELIVRICLILEGCYPYIFGGVSTWMHQYINEMKEHEFVLWVIGANAKDKGKFVYELPKNVVEVHEVFLDDALRLKDSGKMLHAFTDVYKRQP